MSSGATIAAIVAGKQRQYIRRFSAAGATSPEQARSLEEVDCRSSVVFHGLLRRGIVVESAPGRFYLDVEASARMDARRHRALAIAMALLVVIALVYFLTR